LQAADRLKVIARYGVGVDGVDLEAARERGIVVTNTPGANSASVAELALGGMLAMARQLPVAIQATQKGQWPRLGGISLQGKTIGILGLGAIGKQLALRLAGFECQVVAYDPFPDLDFASRHAVRLARMEEVVAQADFLSLHLPLLPETRGLVNQAFLAQMKPGAFLVNTSRGEVIDEAALVEALNSEHVRGAALDAFIQEPPDPDHPLLRHPAVIATPHLGAQTDGATNQMGRMALNDCLAVLRGQAPAHRVI
jgi:D-3-phosphoglycerate dehydrogenase